MYQIQLIRKETGRVLITTKLGFKARKEAEELLEQWLKFVGKNGITGRVVEE